MATISDPKYLQFIDVLGMRLFRIPPYQRAYSWTKEQIEDLLNDISKLYGVDPNSKNSNHFMATIVCMNTNEQKELGSNVLPILNVVDGQQRLTTLIILLKAISKKMLEIGGDENKDEGETLNKLLVKKDNDQLVLLQTNHDSSNMFRNYLKYGTKQNRESFNTLAEKLLCDAYNICEKFVDDWHKTKDIIGLLKIIKNRLKFVFHELPDDQSVYTVFEVLNSRGLPVDGLDKCKSMLMGIAFEKCDSDDAAKETIGEMQKLWGKIFRAIGTVKMKTDEIVRFSATLMYDKPVRKPVSEENALTYFRGLCEKTPSKTLEITESVTEVAEVLSILHRSKRLKAVFEISHSRLLAVAIKLSKTLSDKEKDEIFGIWENISFKIFGLCEKDSRFSVGDFTELAYDIYNKNISKDKIIERLNNIGAKYFAKESIENLAESDCYNNWEVELRYFLYRYEEYLSKKAGENLRDELWEKIWESSTSTTIEHIFPQTPSKDWTGKIDSTDDSEIIKKNVNRLGNLALLSPGVNSSIKNHSFDDKKSVYKTSGLHLVSDLAQLSDWNLDEIKKREKAMIEFAKTIWE